MLRWLAPFVWSVSAWDEAQGCKPEYNYNGPCTDSFRVLQNAWRCSNGLIKRSRMHFAILMIASLCLKESRSEWAKCAESFIYFFLFGNNIFLTKWCNSTRPNRRLLLTIKQQSNMWNLIEGLPCSIRFSTLMHLIKRMLFFFIVWKHYLWNPCSPPIFLSAPTDS